MEVTILVISILWAAIMLCEIFGLKILTRLSDRLHDMFHAKELRAEIEHKNKIIHEARKLIDRMDKHLISYDNQLKWTEVQYNGLADTVMRIINNMPDGDNKRKAYDILQVYLVTGPQAKSFIMENK